MSTPLATVATEFLERQGLTKSTVQSYELTLLPLLAEYSSYPIEILSRSTLIAYLDGLSHLAYTTHQRHQAIINHSTELIAVNEQPNHNVVHPDRFGETNGFAS